MNMEKPETALKKEDGDLNGPEKAAIEGRGFVMKGKPYFDIDWKENDGSAQEPEKEKEAAAEKSEKPQYLEDDPRYKKVFEELALFRLKDRDIAGFNEKFSGEISPEGYLLDRNGEKTDMKPSEIARLSLEDEQLAIIQFERSYPQEAKKYKAKEAARIYDDPEKDPALAPTMREIFSETDSIFNERHPHPGKKEIDEDWPAIKSEVGAPHWEKFVKDYPQKAKAYAEKGHKEIKEAVEKIEKSSKKPAKNQEKKNKTERNKNQEETDLGEFEYIKNWFDDMLENKDSYSETLRIKPDGTIDRVLRFDGTAVFLSAAIMRPGPLEPSEIYNYIKEINQKYPEYNINFEEDPSRQWLKYTVSKSVEKIKIGEERPVTDLPEKDQAEALPEKQPESMGKKQESKKEGEETEKEIEKIRERLNIPVEKILPAAKKEYIPGPESSASKNQGFIMEKEGSEQKMERGREGSKEKPAAEKEKIQAEIAELRVPFTAERIRENKELYSREIKKEKGAVLPERMAGFFEEFGLLDKENLKSILETGKTKEGKEFESSFMGTLDPETAKLLASTFKKIGGVPESLLPIALRFFPDIPKKLDSFLIKAAEEEVALKKEEQRTVSLRAREVAGGSSENMKYWEKRAKEWVDGDKKHKKFMEKDSADSKAIKISGDLMIKELNISWEIKELEAEHKKNSLELKEMESEDKKKTFREVEEMQAEIGILQDRIWLKNRNKEILLQIKESKTARKETLQKKDRINKIVNSKRILPINELFTSGKE
jgi:hypothetical protein